MEVCSQKSVKTRTLCSELQLAALSGGSGDVFVWSMNSTGAQILNIELLSIKRTSGGKSYIHLYDLHFRSTDYQPGRLSDLIFRIFLNFLIRLKTKCSGEEVKVAENGNTQVKYKHLKIVQYSTQVNVLGYIPSLLSYVSYIHIYTYILIS